MNQEIVFTSYHQFGQDGIVELSESAFASSKEANAEHIKQWKEKVKSRDYLI